MEKKTDFRKEESRSRAFIDVTVTGAKMCLCAFMVLFTSAAAVSFRLDVIEKKKRSMRPNLRRN